MEELNIFKLNTFFNSNDRTPRRDIYYRKDISIATGLAILSEVYGV